MRTTLDIDDDLLREAINAIERGHLDRNEAVPVYTKTFVVEAALKALLREQAARGVEPERDCQRYQRLDRSRWSCPGDTRATRPLRYRPAASSRIACAAVIAVMCTIESTLAPCCSTFTGRFKPSTIGPITSAPPVTASSL